MTMNENTLDFAINIAKDAGQILLSYYGKELTRNIKSDENDYSTEADDASEKYIIEQIQKKFPDDEIVAEESGKHIKDNAEYTWIIDPLDGTSNFANGRDDFGAFIARCKGEVPELVVAFDPVKRKLATAMLGKGTFLNEEKITLKSAEELSENPFGANLELHSKLEVLGSSVTNNSAISATLNALEGQYKGYVCNVGAIWDFVVPALLLSEAGWKVTNFSNTPFVWDGITEYGLPGIIAAPTELHNQIAQILQHES